MGLLSIFKRADATVHAASEPSDGVQRARTRARQRLIGAAVLVVIGIIGFPLVFETQPRPIQVDIPIEVPRKEGAPALVMPAARPPAANSSAASLPGAPPMAAAPNDVITEPREEPKREPAAVVPAPVVTAAPAAASKPEPKPAAVAAPEPAVKPAAEPEVKPSMAGSDAARAKALLEGKPAPASGESGRFIVQVGAFADAGAARETRLKAEKLGLKTYTQVASTASGNRIRVRIGPFGSRDEADKAMAKAKSAGLSAVVLTL